MQYRIKSSTLDIDATSSIVEGAIQWMRINGVRPDSIQITIRKGPIDIGKMILGGSNEKKESIESKLEGKNYNVCIIEPQAKSLGGVSILFIDSSTNEILVSYRAP